MRLYNTSQGKLENKSHFQVSPLVFAPLCYVLVSIIGVPPGCAYLKSLRFLLPAKPQIHKINKTWRTNTYHCLLLNEGESWGHLDAFY